MRPAGRGPLESLYFRYPQFFAKDIDPTGSSVQQQVVIVGAGPIGLTAALTLAQYGIRSIVLDRKDTFNDGSRATCIARQSMQIFQWVGAVQPFLEKALGWQRGRSYYKGTEIFILEMPHSGDEKFLPMYNLQQQYTEQFLWDAAVKCPYIDIRWQNDVINVTQSNNVSIEVKTPDKNYSIKATYCLAADGARSAVRSHLGLRLNGDNYEGRYIIADVQMDHDFPTERRALFNPKSNPDGTVLCHKQPDNIWRIDYQLGKNENEEEALSEVKIRSKVGAILKDLGHEGAWDLEWWSIYSANTLCLDDYRCGRVLFIGDSAHIVPIFGVRGLNNGIADAQNAGWKLGYVLNGLAGESLLDSYSPERRDATLDVFTNATKSTRFMTPPTRGWQLARDAALSLAEAYPFAREFANPRQMTPYTYARSALTPFTIRDSEFSTGPVSGSACINAKFEDGSYLLDKTGHGFCAIYFSDENVPEDISALLKDLGTLDPRFTSLILSKHPRNAQSSREIRDVRGHIRARFGADSGTLYLLRPDQHVAGRWRAANRIEILETMRRCLGKTGGLGKSSAAGSGS